MTCSTTTPTTGLSLPHLINYSSSPSTAGSPSRSRAASPTPGPRAKRPRLAHPTPKVTAANLNHVHVSLLREDDSFVDKAFLYLENRIAELEAEKKDIVTVANENEAGPERDSEATSSSSTAANLNHVHVRRLREDDTFVNKAFLYLEGRVGELEGEKKEIVVAAVAKIARATTENGAESEPELETTSSSSSSSSSSTTTTTVVAAAAAASKPAAAEEKAGPKREPKPEPDSEPKPEAVSPSSSSENGATTSTDATTSSNTDEILTANTTLQTEHDALKLNHADLTSRNADHLLTAHNALQASHSALKLAHADLTSRHAALSKLHEIPFDPEAELDYYFGKRNF